MAPQLEYVTVSFPSPRRVFIDGKDCGQVGDILRVAPGTHRFKLGDPQDYTPGEVTRQIVGTDPLQPASIVFTPK
jgi:hypothetical protein